MSLMKADNKWATLSSFGCPLPCIQTYYTRLCGPKRAENYIFRDYLGSWLDVEKDEKHLKINFATEKKVI